MFVQKKKKKKVYQWDFFLDSISGDLNDLQIYT